VGSGQAVVLVSSSTQCYNVQRVSTAGRYTVRSTSTNVHCTDRSGDSRVPGRKEDTHRKSASDRGQSARRILHGGPELQEPLAASRRSFALFAANISVAAFARNLR